VKSPGGVPLGDGGGDGDGDEDTEATEAAVELEGGAAAVAAGLAAGAGNASRGELANPAHELKPEPEPVVFNDEVDDLVPTL